MPHLVVRTVRGLEALVADEIGHRGIGRIEWIGHRELVVEATDPSLVASMSTIDDALLLGTVVEGIGPAKADLARLVRGLDDIDPSRLTDLGSVHGVDVTASFVGRRAYNRYDIEDAVGGYLARRTTRPYHSRRGDRRPPAGTSSWRVTLDGPRATVAVRIGDHPVHRRAYKRASVPGTLHPPVAAMMVRLAEVRPGHLVLDPCCGAGTIVIEGRRAIADARFVGIDRATGALQAAATNAAGLPIGWVRADAGRLPFAEGTLDRVVVNPPWSRQVPAAGLLAAHPDRLWRQAARVLRPGGRIVALVHDDSRLVGLTVTATYVLRLCGTPVTMVVATA